RPHRGNNTKLQAGGIRDIEFTAQCLQLLSGRRDPRVRSRSTLEAVARLRRAGALKPVEARHLAEAYRFLRHLENLLQIQEGRPAYAVPDSAAERGALARRLGLADAAAFEAHLSQVLARVRAVSDAVFGAGDEEAGDPRWLLAATPGSGAAAAALQALGFADGAACHRVLVELATGGPAPAASRRHFGALLPALLPALAAAPAPDAGLTRFAGVVRGYGAPGPFFELVRRRPGFRAMLVALCGSSGFLADLLQRDPGLLDGLVGYGDQGGGGLEPGGDLSMVRRVQAQEVLRIGADDLLHLVPSEETFRRLSDLAVRALTDVWARCWRRRAQQWGRPRTRGSGDAVLACLAAGELGGGELDFGSDLDLFFVCEGDGQTGRGYPSAQLFAEVAQDVIVALGETGLYRVDARLRPEGTNAPVVIGLAAYRRYLRTRAATWERLALIRARAVAGDADLGAHAAAEIRRFVYGAPLTRETLREIADLRRRMEPPRSRAGGVDIKRSPGGIVDAEFIAQILALHLGGDHPASRQTSTASALELLAADGILSGADGQSLRRGYARLREVEKGLRIGWDRPASVLPEGAAPRALSRTVGAGEPEALVAELTQLMARIRQIYERLLARLASATPTTPARERAEPA
ncbi:MAG: hypothetical protein ABIL09_07910, partial [Gemmatimonadota bacterium]